MTFARSMRLLAHDSASDWPEFAHLECYQCHHDLRRDSWRIRRGYGGRKPGALIPNASRFVVLQDLAAQVAGDQSASLRESVGALNKLLASNLGNTGRRHLGNSSDMATFDALRFGSGDRSSP